LILLRPAPAHGGVLTDSQQLLDVDGFYVGKAHMPESWQDVNHFHPHREFAGHYPIFR
jgi:hypothetical protein